MDLKEEDILGADIGQHWYYRSKAAALRRAVGGLDAAAPARCRRGLGLLLAPSAGRDRRAIRALRRYRLSTRTRRQRRRQARALPPRLRPDRLRPRADDGRAGACRRRPRALVRHYAAKVPSGAHFLVTVPAFRFLWSGHDVFLEHKRRYRLSEIESGDARRRPRGGAAAPTISAWCSRSPPRCASPRAMRPSPEAASRSTARSPTACWRAICAAELPLFPLNRLAGLSAFVLAKKP